MTIRLFLITANDSYAKAMEDFLPAISNAIGHELLLTGIAVETQIAQNQITEERPDLILADIGHPGGVIDGLAIARWAHLQKGAAAGFTPRIVLCSLYEDDIFREASMQAGAAAFLVKDRLDSQLPPILAKLFPSEAYATSLS